ncbi:TetR/AcrR family transcriptional regulator [Streptomyces sp. NPDC048172]|uniref:TetR/AcrR family transcriptional regulator n=1 Tax=Streptomyces sp. NPDC048172 TaxID=3365505 RepID=UPI003714CF81
MARRARGTSAGLDRTRIAAAAVALVDREGPERFGVRRLADELGVDPMSIYHHIKGKAALLDAVCEAVLAEVDVADDGGGGDEGASEDWEAVARRLAYSYRDMALRHPQIFPLLLTHAQTSPAAVSATSPAILAALERLLTAMRDTGLPDELVVDTPMVLISFLNGHLLARTSGGETGPGAVPAIDADAHPTLSVLAHRLDDFGSREEFDRMLDTVLDGVRARAGRAGRAGLT